MKKSETLVVWRDPDDYDNAMNRGVDIFKNNEDMLEWLPEFLETRPSASYTVYEKCISVAVKSVEVVTKLEIVR